MCQHLTVTTLDGVVAPLRALAHSQAALADPDLWAQVFASVRSAYFYLKCVCVAGWPVCIGAPVSLIVGCVPCSFPCYSPLKAKTVVGAPEPPLLAPKSPADALLAFAQALPPLPSLVSGALLLEPVEANGLSWIGLCQELQDRMLSRELAAWQRTVAQLPVMAADPHATAHRNLLAWCTDNEVPLPSEAKSASQAAIAEADQRHPRLVVALPAAPVGLGPAVADGQFSPVVHHHSHGAAPHRTAAGLPVFAAPRVPSPPALVLDNPVLPDLLADARALVAERATAPAAYVPPVLALARAPLPVGHDPFGSTGVSLDNPRLALILSVARRKGASRWRP